MNSLTTLESPKLNQKGANFEVAAQSVNLPKGRNFEPNLQLSNQRRRQKQQLSNQVKTRIPKSAGIRRDQVEEDIKKKNFAATLRRRKKREKIKTHIKADD